MIDLYSGLRVNNLALLIGPPVHGKTTIWKTIVNAINSLQNKPKEGVNKQTFKTIFTLNRLIYFIAF